MIKSPCASLLLAHGIKIDEISTWLGHSNVRTTEIYANREVINKQSLANVISNVLAKDKVA